MTVKKSHAKCSNCGGMLSFDPKTKNLSCNNCHTNQDFEKTNSNAKKTYYGDIPFSMRKSNLCSCTNCGAEVEVGENNITHKCPYCNTSFVLENSEINGLVPDLIIPFEFDKTTAKENYKKGVAKRKFLPNKFKNSPNLDSIWGTYLPIFSFDCNTDSTYRGILEIDHSKTDSQGRRYTETTTKHISGSKSLPFNDVLVEASSHINQWGLDSIKPFNIYETFTYEYSADFIRGYEVKTNDCSLSSCKILSESIIKEKIKNIILSQYHYSRVRSFYLSTTFSDYKYAYMLVPVYFVGFKYKNKDYEVYINGQTGKLGGKLPRSGWKIAFLVLGILIPILLFILIATLAH